MKKWIFPMMLLSFFLLAFVSTAGADDRDHRGRRGLAVQAADSEHSLRDVADRHDRRPNWRNGRKEYHRTAVRDRHRSHRYNDRDGNYNNYTMFYTNGYGIFLNYGRGIGYGYRNGWGSDYGHGRRYGTPGRYGVWRRCR